MSINETTREQWAVAVNTMMQNCIHVTAYSIQNAERDMRQQSQDAIRDFARSVGMIGSVASALSKRDCASVYNVAVKSAASSSPDALKSMLQRMEADYLMRNIGSLSGGSYTPPAGGSYTPTASAIERYRATYRQEPVNPATTSADLSEYVKRPEARRIAETVLVEAGDDLCKQAAKAAHDAAQQVINGFKASEPVTLVIERPNMPDYPVGLVHRMTPLIIKALAAGENVYLHGPAGSGKTTVAQKAAQVFNLQFYFAAKVESEYLLLGFRDARGETVRTQFREAYENGGLFLFDELDGSSPAAIVALNAALANGVCPFPDGIVNRHADFKCIAAGNTKLRGATGAYTGRSQLDAASIDRFVFIEFNYDEAMEYELASHKGWCAYVQAVRKAVKARSMDDDILITPRATISGCNLILAGFDAETVKRMTVFKGLDADTIGQIEYNCVATFTDEDIAPSGVSEPTDEELADEHARTIEEAHSPFEGVDLI